MATAKKEIGAGKGKTEQKPRGVLFDTAAGAPVLPLSRAENRTPLPGVQGPALENASGDSIRTGGEVYGVDFVTGSKLLPGRLAAAGVVQPILSASHYCGPGGEFEALLRPKNPLLLHKPSKESYPLRWEDGTL